MKEPSNQPSLDKNQLIDTAGAAVLLDIPKATIVKWRCTGSVDLPFIKIGHAVKYSTADLRAWIEKNTQNKPTGDNL